MNATTKAKEPAQGKKRLSSIRNRIILGVLLLILCVQVISAVVQSYQVNSIYLNDFSQGAENLTQVAYLALDRMALTGQIVRPGISDEELSRYINLYVQIIQLREFESILGLREDLSSISFFSKDDELVVSSKRPESGIVHINTWKGEEDEVPPESFAMLDQRSLTMRKTADHVVVYVPYIYEDIYLGGTILRYESSNLTSALYRTYATAAALIIVYMLLASLLMHRFITRVLTRPIREMTRMMDEMAEGKLDQWYQIKTMDEIGQMGQSVNDLIASLQRTFTDIKSAMGQDESGVASSGAQRDSMALSNEIKRAEFELRLLSRSLINAIEDERKKIADDLHDEVGSVLTTLQWDLNLIEQCLNDEHTRQRDHCQAAMKTTRELAKIIRTTCSRLRPDLLEEMGLASAVAAQVEDLNEQMDEMTIEFHSNLDRERLDPGTELALYRIFQEALTNTMKHSHAEHVTVSLNLDASIVLLSIEDDGVGFQPDDRGLPRVLDESGIGLLSMKERALSLGGQLKIESRKNVGTRIEVQISVDVEEE